MDLQSIVNTISVASQAAALKITGSDKINTAKKAGQTLLTAKNINKINSIKGKARQSIAQYPALVSENLNPKLVPILTNALEVEYASLVWLVIANTSSFDSGDSSSVINQFHNLNGGLKEEYFLCGTERVHDIYEENAKLLEPYEESFNMKTLNETYYTKSMKEFFNEAKNLNSLKGDELKDEISRRKEKRDSDKYGFDKKRAQSQDKVQSVNNKINAVKNTVGTASDLVNVATNISREIDRKKDAAADRAQKNYDSGKGTVLTSMKDLNKINDLHPTILNIEVNFREPETGNVVKKQLSIGVKCVAHLLTSDSIQYYLTKAAYKNNGFLRFIKWTTGEIKFWKDLIFTLDDIKLSAVQNSKSLDKNSFARLEYIAKTAKHTMLTGAKEKSVPAAITTLIITKTDVENIKYKDGIDILSNPGYLKKIFDAYYLLNLLIVDESLDIVYTYDPFGNKINRQPFSSFEKASKERVINANDLFKLAK